MLKGFRDFVLRGNVVDLAIGVVIGAAFGGVVASFTGDVLTPIIGAIVGKPDFSAMIFTLNGSPILVGKFLNALIAFLLVAAAVYYFVVTPMNSFMARFKKEAPPDKKKCPECLSDVPIDAKRCAFCTSSLANSAKA
jgi:large conductance mechanosensitive channel